MLRIPVRVVCHAILRIDLVPSRVRTLRDEVERRCKEGDARLVEFVVDLGMPKQQPDDYPALNYLRGGSADALMVVSVPLFDRRNQRDLLASKTLTAGTSLAWRTVPELRRLGLLPAAIGPRSFARLRAETLRERRFPMDAIARWLGSEGYIAPSKALGHWTRADVTKLLREPSAAPTPLPDEPIDGPAAAL